MSTRFMLRCHNGEQQMRIDVSPCLLLLQIKISWKFSLKTNVLFQVPNFRLVHPNATLLYFLREQYSTGEYPQSSTCLSKEIQRDLVPVIDYYTLPTLRVVFTHAGKTAGGNNSKCYISYCENLISSLQPQPTTGGDPYSIED
ncbi:hypothetical protein Avbf_08413 [Armadillidium vulgare]|nr:hypothetical protein Avbf_08413 [Armadillidium vulgare]